MLRLLCCSIFSNKQQRNLLSALILQYGIYFLCRGGLKMNTLTLVSEQQDQYLPLWKGSITGEIKIFFLEKGQEQNTHMHGLHLIKESRIICLCDPYSQPFTIGFLQMEFWDISDEALVPCMLQGRWHKYLHNELWGVFDIWWVPHQTEQISASLKHSRSCKRSNSLEETIFSSLCYNAELQMEYNRCIFPYTSCPVNWSNLAGKALPCYL